MSNHSGFDRGVLAGLLIAVGGSAVNWMITPMSHPDASRLRTIGVAIQALLGLGIGIWLIARDRSERARRSAPVNTPVNTP